MIICKNCRAQLDDSDKVCRYCGAPLTPDVPPAAPAYAAPASAPLMGSAGYSRLVDSKEVVAALKKNNRVSNIAVAVFVVLPFLGFLIYGAVSDKMDVGKAAVYGIIISAIFAFVSLIVAIRHKLDKPFEGTVVDKKKTFRSGNSQVRGGKSRTKYTVRFECEDGKRRKKEVNIPVYEYLEIGERVRYLPQFPQPYEKYDKRPDGNVLCMFCSQRNPLTETTCAFCHKPLIK